jgi:hypothetical protein
MPKKMATQTTTLNEPVGSKYGWRPKWFGSSIRPTLTLAVGRGHPRSNHVPDGWMSSACGTRIKPIAARANSIKPLVSNFRRCAMVLADNDVLVSISGAGKVMDFRRRKMIDAPKLFPKG